MDTKSLFLKLESVTHLIGRLLSAESSCISLLIVFAALHTVASHV